MKIYNGQFYVPPQWCKMSPPEHFDGMGGCWSLSSGYIAESGIAFCSHTGNWPINSPCAYFDRDYPKLMRGGK